MTFHDDLAWAQAALRHGGSAAGPDDFGFWAITTPGGETRDVVPIIATLAAAAAAAAIHPHTSQPPAG